jgi:hypothetical protein
VHCPPHAFSCTPSHHRITGMDDYKKGSSEAFCFSTKIKSPIIVALSRN